MIIQCPDCETKMRPKPPANTPEGTKVSITCRCGTRLRFRMPGKPKPPSRLGFDPADWADVFKPKATP